MLDPIIHTNFMGNMPLSDARRRASNMAASIADKIKNKQLVLGCDLDFLNYMASLINIYALPGKPNEEENTTC